MKRPSPASRLRPVLAACALAVVAALAVSRPAAAQDPAAAGFISKAVYQGHAAGPAAEFTLAISAQVFGEAWAEVPLPRGEYTVKAWKSDRPEAARLLSDGASSKFLLQKKGKYQLELTVALPVADAKGLRTLELPLVPAAACAVDLDVEGQDLEFACLPEAPLAVSGPGGSHVRLVPPPAESITLQWYPKARKAEFGPGFRIADETLYTVTKGVVEGRTTLRVLVGRGGVERVDVRLAKKGFVLAVAGDTVEQWFVEEQADGRVLHVAFSPRIAKEAQFTIRHDLPIEAIPGPAALAPLTVDGALEQAGVLAVASDTDLALREDQLTGLEKVDLATLRETFRGAAGHVRYGYRYAKPAAGVTLAVERKTPRVRTSAETFALVEKDTLVMRTIAQVTIDEVGTSDLRFRIPEDLSILTVTGREIRDWHVSAGILYVTLVRRHLGTVALQVEGQAVTAGKNQVTLPRLETLDAVDESGYLGVMPRGEVALETAKLTGAVQVDPRELPAWLQKAGARLAYRYADRKAAVSVAVVPLTPEVRATVYSRYQVEEGRVAGAHQVAAEISRAQVFALDLTVPPGQTPLTVTGEGVRDWTFRAADRTLRVELAAGRLGGVELSVTSEERFPGVPERASLAGLLVNGVKDYRGWAGIAASEEIELAPDKTDRVRDVGGAGIPEPLRNLGATQFAYQCNAADWSVGLAVKALQPRLEAKSVTLLEMRKGLFTALAFIDLSVTRAGINRLSVKLPKDAVNSNLETDGVQSKHLANGVWEVAFNGRRKGDLRLKVSYEKLIAAADGAADFANLEIPGLERHTGYVLVARDQASAEVKLLEKKEMGETQRTDLPPEFRDAALVYTHLLQFPAAAATARFRVESHDIGQVEAARIADCDLFSVVQKDGDMMTYLRGRMTNTTKQYLELTFPSDAVVWGAYLNAKPVKPNVVADGKVHIPLARTTTGQVQFEVAVVWAQKVKGLGLGAKVPFAVPESDVKMESVKWALYLPSGYHVLSSDGSLKLAHVDEGMEAPFLFGRMYQAVERAWQAIPPWLIQVFVWAFWVAVALAGFFILVRAILFLMDALKGRQLAPLPKWAFAVVLIVVVAWAGVTMVGRQTASLFKRSTSALATGEVSPAPQTDSGSFTGIEEAQSGPAMARAHAPQPVTISPHVAASSAQMPGEPAAPRPLVRQNKSIGLNTEEVARAQGRGDRAEFEREARARLRQAYEDRDRRAENEKAKEEKAFAGAGKKADLAKDGYRYQQNRQAAADDRLKELEEGAQDHNESGEGIDAETVEKQREADESIAAGGETGKGQHEQTLDRLEGALARGAEAGGGGGAAKGSPLQPPVTKVPPASPATTPAPKNSEHAGLAATDRKELEGRYARKPESGPRPPMGAVPAPAAPADPSAPSADKPSDSTALPAAEPVGGDKAAGVGGAIAGPAGVPANIPGAAPAKRPVAGPGGGGAAPKVGLLQVQAALKAADASLFARVERGRVSGALPITVALPVGDTLAVQFENSSIAGGRGTVDLWCIAGQGCLALQAVLVLALALGLFGLGARRPYHAAVGACCAILVALLAGKGSQVPIEPYVATVVWTAGVILGVQVLRIIAREWKALRTSGA